MESPSLSTLTSLSAIQKAALSRANIKTVADLLLLSHYDLSKRCRITPTDAQNIVDRVCEELYKAPLSLDDPSVRRDEVFSTGNENLDNALGGGIRTGMLWEVVGESAAGKSQFAFQLSLFVQLPSEHGGISGSACFLSTSWTLPTHRLLEIIQENPLLSPNVCDLSDVHTLKTPTIPILLRVLASVLPDFIKERRTNPKAKPVKLLVIDALTELFHSNGKTSSQTLTQRSKDLSEIAVHLHSIASQHNIAIIVLNEVVDVFNRDFYNQDPGKPGEVVYRDQSRLFGRADSIPGEDRKEAALGLVWANIVNARIMLSRTDRMRDSSDFDVRPIKRRRVSEQGPSPSHTDDPASESLRVRRLSVIFNQHAPPASLDYIVTKKGVSVVSGVEPPVSAPCPGPRLQAGPSRTTAHVAPLSREHPQLSGELLTLHGAEPEQDVPDVPPAEHEDGAEDGPQDEVDEWDEYWKQVDMKDGDLYNNLDMDALFSSNPG